MQHEGEWREPRQLRAGVRLKQWFLTYGDVVGILGLLMVLYVVTYLYNPVRKHPALYQYVLQPGLWGSVALLAWWGWRRWGEEIADLGAHLLWALGGGVAVLVVWLFSGFLTSLGYSPYAHSFPWLLANLWYVAVKVLGKEWSRSLLLYRTGRRSPELAFVGTVLLFTLASLAPGVWHIGPNRTGWVIMLTETVLPMIALEILYTYVAWTGGPWAAVAIHGLRDVVEWTLPYLPNPGWAVRGLVGTLTPLLVLIVMAWVYERFLYPQAEEAGQVKPSAQEENRQEDEAISWGWLLASVLALLLIWLTSGLLGIRPLVIQGISMEPTYHHGDLVLVRRVPIEQVKVGQVVVFHHGWTRIAHRVIAIQEQGGERVLITQGDNNNVPDAPVTAQDLEGVVVLWLPKVGWLSLGLKALLGAAH